MTRTALDAVSRAPVTVSYLLVLVLVRTVLSLRVDAPAIEAWISTNLDNLRAHPVGSLLADLFVINGSLFDPHSAGGVLITVGLGLGGALWWLETRRGAAVAVGAVLLGQIGATLIAAAVISAAVAAGRYPPEVTSELDVGISYGAQVALAAASPALPRWARPLGVAFVLAWPLNGAEWSGWLPDFTTVGHLVSAALGFALAALAGRLGARPGRASRRAPREEARTPPPR